MRNSAFSRNVIWLSKEITGTTGITEPLAMKGPKGRKETKVTWGPEENGDSMAPKERRATQGFRRNCR